MNLLFITNKFPPLSCGVGDYTYHLAKEFVNSGYIVSIICRTDQSIKDHWQMHDEGFQVYPIGGNWQRRDWKLVLENIQQIKPATVLFQYVPGSYDRYAVPWHLIYFYRQLQHLPVKIVTTFHETYVRYNWTHPKYLYLAIGQRIIARVVAKLSHQLITSIDRYEGQLLRWNPKIKQIPIGSNITPISVSDHEIMSLRHRIAPNGEKVLSTFGIRDHVSLLKLFQRVLEEDTNFVLLIIGKLRADLSYFPELVQKKIYITGFLDSPDVYRHLKASDAFIMFDFVNKKGEGGTCNKSGSLAAAFAAGLPIIATKGDMTNRLILEGAGIIWIDYHPSMSMKILKYLNEDISFLRKLSDTFYKEQLSWNSIYSKYLR
ncbi:MAG: glycosyltransferase [Algoriphagus sp.]|uniref:glycosyltransferase n=1 Tax=Algoriphagus sp. TaxID=1872435 RepID=UPI00180E5C1C|nr:glycosyltransferase [Algoriphagus sp.]NVJ85996.1 glycosyltransferase [Algoriphagus sp.]